MWFTTDTASSLLVQFNPPEKRNLHSTLKTDTKVVFLIMLLKVVCDFCKL